MLHRVSANRAYVVGVASALVSAVVLVVTVLAQAVERTQAFI